jgi:hypothetical protein
MNLFPKKFRPLINLKFWLTFNQFCKFPPLQNIITEAPTRESKVDGTSADHEGSQGVCMKNGSVYDGDVLRLLTTA